MVRATLSPAAAQPTACHGGHGIGIDSMPLRWDI